MKRSKNNSVMIKDIVFILAIVILAVFVTAAMTQGFSNWNPYGWLGTPSSSQDEDAVDPVDVITTEIKDSQNLRMKMSAMTTAENEMTATLTATVNPSSAANNKINWRVEWATEDTQDDVKNYVYLTNNGNVATVHVTNAFLGKNIIVFATTEEGGFTATCTLIYKGKPSAISIADKNGLTESGGKFIARCNMNYAVTLGGDNIFHVVDPSILDFEITAVQGFGKVKVNIDHRDDTTSTPVITSEESTLDLSTVVESSTTSGILDLYSIFNQSVSISNGKTLNLSAGRTIEAMNVWITTGARHADVYTFKSYIDAPENVYLQVSLKEKNSNLTMILKVRITSSVSGIELDNSEIVF